MSSVFFRGGKYDSSGADKLLAAVRRAGDIALRILGYNIRNYAKGSIKHVSTPEPSPAGTPPYTHDKPSKNRKTSGQLPESIVYALEPSPQAVIIGPSIALFSNVGKPHEKSGGFRGRDYPQRPFMGPALAAEVGELPGLLATQIERQFT